MLIDWVSAAVSLELLSEQDRQALRKRGDRVQRFNLETGAIAWETQAWDSIRSDSHQLSFHVGSDVLRLQGSPARVFGDGDAVFGSDAAAALDLPGCVERMAAVLAHALGVTLPVVSAFKVTRTDITQNLLLRDLADVRAALRVLRDCEGGRYRVNQQAGDTVYWSKGSSLRKGKAYAKGPHLRYLMAKVREFSGRQYTRDEIAMADRLLRLELTLAHEWWRRQRESKAWYEVTVEELREQWQRYFERMMGQAEVTEMNIGERVRAVAKTEGEAKAAEATWLLIKAYGWEMAKDRISKRSWYRHLKLLRAAGLSDADISSGNVVPFRRPLIAARMVDSWAQLRSECGSMAA